MIRCDVAALEAASRLSAISNEMIQLTERMLHRLVSEYSAATPRSEQADAIRIDLGRALTFQKSIADEYLKMIRCTSICAQSASSTMPDENENAYPCASATEKVLDVTSTDSSPVSAPKIPFTRREQEIVNMVAQGFDNKQIEYALCIAPQTVKNHMHAIYGKAAVSDRSELSEFAKLGERRTRRRLPRTCHNMTGEVCDAKIAL